MEIIYVHTAIVNYNETIRPFAPFLIRPTHNTDTKQIYMHKRFACEMRAGSSAKVDLSIENKEFIHIIIMGENCTHK